MRVGGSKRAAPAKRKPYSEDSDIRVEITDARTGKQLGHFNGYGTGRTWFPEGGVPYMARNDLNKNYKKLAEYLIQATQ